MGLKNNHNGDFYLSDESDFYGDENEKQEMESKSLAYSWHADSSAAPSLTRKANIALAKMKALEKTKEKTSQSHPFDGIRQFRQSTETVDEFLLRLPPRTTEVSNDLPWIRVNNPFNIEVQRSSPIRDLSASNGEEENEEAGLTKFRELGHQTLEDLLVEFKSIEKQSASQPQASINRQLNEARDRAVKQIQNAARVNNVKAGKWLLFVMPTDVDEVWRCITQATIDNELGIAAKVAPRSSETDREARLICIYTKDFNDEADVRRVLMQIKSLGLIRTTGNSMGIYYKCDAYTHLQINSGNPYRIKASIYSSKEMLASKEEVSRKRKNRD